MQSVLKIHGGKRYLAKAINKLMPEHKHYVETHGGTLAVLLEHDPHNHSEVANDLNGELTNFWHVLQQDYLFEKLIRLLEAIPVSEDEFYDAGESKISDTVIDAARFFIRCRQSRAGCFKEFSPIVKNRLRRGMNDNVSAWLTAIERLPEVHARLKRVLITNRDAIDLIWQQDGYETLFYCDPPYVNESRESVGQYALEYTDAQHAELLDTLLKINGKFLLSGYHNEMYDAWAARHGIKCIEFDLANHASGAKENGRETECVWLK